MRPGIALLPVVVLLAGPGARATPLDLEVCVTLKSEQSRLEQAGVRGVMAKGPEWAKSNLAADKLEDIRKLVELDEQLQFRCPTSRPLVSLPVEPEGGEENVEAPAAGAAKAGAAAPEKNAPAAKKAAAAPPAGVAKPEPAKKKAAPAAKTAAPVKDAKAAGQAAPAKTAKPKPKTDDAYRPAPADPAANPFAGQTQPLGKP